MKTNPAMEKIGLKPNHQLMNPEFEGKHKEYYIFYYNKSPKQNAEKCFKQ